MNTYVVGHINAMREFIRHFPLSLLDFFKGKTYDSMIDFILDILYACGIDVEEEIMKMLCKLFKVEELGYFSPDILYEKLAKTNLKVESKFLENLEDAVKVAIIESVLAVLGGCSVVPEIKNEHMDIITYQKKGLHVLTKKLSDKNGKKYNGPKSYVYKKEKHNVRFRNNEDAGIISIPLSSIDVFGKLRISPLSSTGSCIYDLGASPTYTSERAYTYYKVIFNSFDGLSQFIRYFLTREEAEGYVNEMLQNELDISANAGESYYNTDNYIKQRKAGFITEGIESYEEALKSAGYIPNDERNGELKELYEILIKSDPKYGQKSFYKKYVKMTPPFPASSLYRVNDLDAVLWYVMYRGTNTVQLEKNKMIWDNRKSRGERTQEEWDYWLNSKEKDGDFIYEKADEQYFESAKKAAQEPVFQDGVQEPSAYKYNGLFPIMQLQRDPIIASEERLAVSIAAQRYYRGNRSITLEANTGSVVRVNHTMYKFNYDYMRSIKIFDAKAILAGMLNELLNGSLFADFGLGFTYGMSVIQAQLSNVVKTALETDDFLSSDCYFKFSNDEYDMLLHREELNRYSAKNVDVPGMRAATIESDDILDMMAEANTSATPSGTVTTIQRTVNAITATPSTEAVINFEGTLKIKSGHLMQFLYNVIMAIIKPIIMCLFAPKVMLIFILNFQVAGLIDLTDPNSLTDIQELIMKKIFSILKCLIKLLINKIVELLLEMFYKYILPILSSYIVQLLIEYVEKWLKLLKEALRCIPMFDWTKYKIQAEIDNVNYADIINNEQKTPESTAIC